MKYELLIDFGQHKKGTIIEQASWGEHPQFATKSQAGFVSEIRFYIDDVPILMKQGIIRKVEEPKWTDSQMIENLEQYGNHVSSAYINFNNILRPEAWLKSKQEGE